MDGLAAIVVGIGFLMIGSMAVGIVLGFAFFLLDVVTLRPAESLGCFLLAMTGILFLAAILTRHIEYALVAIILLCVYFLSHSGPGRPDPDTNDETD